MKQMAISHGDPTEFDIPVLNENELDFRVVRTYKFQKGTSGRALVCDVWFPDWYEDAKQLPAISIQFELNEPRHSNVLRNRIHVWAHWSIPSALVMVETERFFKTFKQMYDL